MTQVENDWVAGDPRVLIPEQISTDNQPLVPCCSLFVLIQRQTHMMRFEQYFDPNLLLFDGLQPVEAHKQV